ncbi:phospholipase SGR2-like [Salvia hispanica]|uniref:phospholipase SGR2-like n=1 Tax=Salvia hispanica TaxID=49212 RepID=UPI00200995BB|nr:phospholipase SGR2-like [Salvia hispanica]XP_047954530.1 phospholipase SGR2-like [Salvia hispanica]
MPSEMRGNVADEVGQTSLDMLKNTPSNIRRLAHEIEQCEGRQKYLARTRSPSDGGDLRWYFCKVPLAENELAASVPRTEVVGKGDYFRFGVRDSLAIEASFLQREEELLSAWWKEYAECSEGPRGKHGIDSMKLSSDCPDCQLSTAEEERVGVPVKGGLYEVDLVRRHCFPVYWYGENRRVLRGHWFARKGGLDWHPIREDVSEQLEYAYRSQVWHRRTFQPSGLFAARVDLQGSTSGLHALFTGEDDTWEAWLSVDSSGFSNIVNIGYNGIKLRRGYAPSESKKPTQDELRQQKEEEMDDYCSQVPVQHLVFMVHGIGQRLEKSNLVDDVGGFRHLTASLAERHLTWHQRGTQRVLYIPCQWRKGLTLSGEAAVEKITLDGVRGLRTMLSATVHDVLYYMSPIYCQDIINSVSNQLNRLYLKFLKRNPGYDGKVSIYGHSLGSVLSYDILCHQDTLCSPFPMEWMYKEQEQSKTHCSMRTDLPHNCKATFDVGEDLNSDMDHESVANFGGEIVVGITDMEREKSEGRRSVGNDLSPDSKHERVEDSGGEGIVSDTDNSNLVEEHVDGVCNQLGPPALSESDESTTNDTSYQQKNDAFTLDENHNQTLDSLNYRGCSDPEMINDPRSMKSEIETCDDEPSGENIKDNCEGEVIKSLREEIELLKSKIKQFEAGIDDIVDAHDGKSAVNEPDKSVVDESDKSVVNEPDSVQDGCRDTVKSYTPQIRYTKLEFKVDTFFAVGSPLGVFLSLRNVRIGIGKGKHYWEEENINEEMPACRQMFNIFHPFDPVAYRVEPLICKDYDNKRPVIIPYHRGGKRLYVGYQEFKEGVAARSQAFVDQLTTIRVKMLTMCEPRSNDGSDDECENSQENGERCYGSVMMERLTGSVDGRVDHVLQDKTFRHPYISAIGSHTNYWRDPDTALFMLRYLYRDIPEEPDEQRESRWSDPREVEDEEAPLTFADNMSIKHFSYKAKNIIKTR